MKKVLLIFATVVLLFSCKSVLKTIKGIRNPKLETHTSLQKYLIKNDLDTTRLVYFKDINSFVLASKKKYVQIPNAYFFDKNGNFVDYRKSVTDCNAKVDGFIQDLNAFSEAKKDPTKTLTELEGFLTSSNKNLISEKDAHVTVFITWARYAGALNKEKAFDWVKLLEEAKQKGISVNYYLLNCDFQESWNLTKEEKEALGVN